MPTLPGEQLVASAPPPPPVEGPAVDDYKDVATWWHDDDDDTDNHDELAASWSSGAWDWRAWDATTAGYAPPLDSTPIVIVESQPAKVTTISCTCSRVSRTLECDTYSPTPTPQRIRLISSATCLATTRRPSTMCSPRSSTCMSTVF